jgi:hypothetical protein
MIAIQNNRSLSAPFNGAVSPDEVGAFLKGSQSQIQTALEQWDAMMAVIDAHSPNLKREAEERAATDARNIAAIAREQAAMNYTPTLKEPMSLPPQIFKRKITY